MVKSTHHIFSQEERAIFNVHRKENTVEIERKKHDALHDLFGNDHPREQLLALLQLNQSVIAPDIIEALKELLEIPEEEFYIQEIFGRKYQKTQ